MLFVYELRLFVEINYSSVPKVVCNLQSNCSLSSICCFMLPICFLRFYTSGVNSSLDTFVEFLFLAGVLIISIDTCLTPGGLPLGLGLGDSTLRDALF